MKLFTFFSAFLLTASFVAAADPTLQTFPNTCSLTHQFDPIKEAYWTGLPHHRRMPFAVSPDGKTGYLAYLSASGYNSVVIQPINPTTFAATGSAVEIADAHEAGGLVAHDDGFAVLVNLGNKGTADPIATIVRYVGGKQAWQTPVNGPTVSGSDGHTMSPDMNGDLVYSSQAKLYGAYFVVTAYDGSAKGHFGDTIQYVDDSGKLKNINGATSGGFGCSHNTGIAIEAADAAPYATVCAEDHGSIWLNTETQGMSGQKIANENVTNGVSGEPMGGMSGSYSSLTRFPGAATFMFAWASRGSLDLGPDDWMGSGYVQSRRPRWLNHNVAIAPLASKSKLAGKEAISVVGAASGDDQVMWITKSATEDHQNVHVAAFPDGNHALVTWELLQNPHCDPVPLSCTGTFAGTYMQVVTSSGATVGSPVVSKNSYVAGDMVIVGNKLCWPYIDTKWDLSAPKSSGTLTQKASFACMAIDGSTSDPAPAPAPSNPAPAPSNPAPSNPPAPAATTPAPPPPPASTTPTKPKTTKTKSKKPKATPWGGFFDFGNTRKRADMAAPPAATGANRCGSDVDCDAEGEKCVVYSKGCKGYCVPFEM